MKNLKVVIIEDEAKSRDVLRNLLERYCPRVHVVGEAPTVDLGAEIIDVKKPELVFLDIELPGQNGFSLFNYFSDPQFEVIFTTAYDQFAIQAFRISAIDYLLKPINFLHLQEAVQKVEAKMGIFENKTKIEVLSKTVEDEEFRKIALPVANGYEFIEINDIIYCKAERNYTQFRLVNNKKFLVSKPLRYFEEALRNLHFFRINRSIMINLNFVKSYFRSQSGKVILSNDECFSVSDQVKQKFLTKLNLPNGMRV